jgi:hypothetical protein
LTAPLAQVILEACLQGRIPVGKAVRIPFEPFLPFSSLIGNSQPGRVSRLLGTPEIKRYFFYGYGRVALLEGLRLLASHPGSNFLLPACICRVAVKPFQDLGIEPRFFEVSPHLSPDTARINSLIDSKTRGIMMVNYFGFPAPNFQEIRSLCQNNGLYLIEDNAHGFLSRTGSRLLGTLGDIGISSLWKQLPITSGAALLVNSDSLARNGQALSELESRRDKYPQMSHRYVYLQIMGSLLSNLELRYRFPAGILRRAYRRLSGRAGDLNGEEFDHSVAMSQVVLRLAEGMDLERACLRRRHNYGVWLDALSRRRGLDIVFGDLPDGICPMVFPVLVDDVETFTRQMSDRGVMTHLWPPLPEEVLDNPIYPVANYLARHMLILPVHQSIGHAALKRASGRPDGAG